MITKYSGYIDPKAVSSTLHRLIGRVYKLLPYREEGLDWETLLADIQGELAGINSLFPNYDDFNAGLCTLQCKLESLLSAPIKEDFDSFRSIIFDCIGRINTLEGMLLCQD